MSMPKVAIRCDLVCGGGVVLFGTLGVDVAVWSSAFLRLVVWLSDASSILGFRYSNVGGVLSVMRADLWDAASVEFRS